MSGSGGGGGGGISEQDGIYDVSPFPLNVSSGCFCDRLILGPQHVGQGRSHASSMLIDIIAKTQKTIYRVIALINISGNKKPSMFCMEG